MKKMTLYIFVLILSCSNLAFHVQSKPEISKDAKLFYEKNELSIANSILKNRYQVETSPDSYCLTKLLGGDNKAIYVYSLCQNKNIPSGVLTSGTGAVKVSYIDSSVTNVEFPRDGSYSSPDKKKLFPKKVRKHYLSNRPEIDKMMEEFDNTIADYNTLLGAIKRLMKIKK